MVWTSHDLVVHILTMILTGHKRDRFSANVE
jgi:hypothetical protein